MKIILFYCVPSRGAGMSAMLEKFKSCDFGRCPRLFCNGQACLPVGLSDVPRQSTVKLFCPKCEDVYYPRSKYHGNLDGGCCCCCRLLCIYCAVHA